MKGSCQAKNKLVGPSYKGQVAPHVGLWLAVLVGYGNYPLPALLQHRRVYGGLWLAASPALDPA
jgi:hypothetical protein